MKLNLISLILTLIYFNSFAQKQANTWYFGKDGAGLDFNNGCIPIVLKDGKINGYEGCASISDKITGQFLFSTNSEWVWNRNQDTIPNSHLIESGNTITQVMIIQKPGNSSLYYIITSEIQAGLSGLGHLGYRFHSIDINMNGGLGGIVFKDSILYSSRVSEKITAIKHSNGTDIWLVGHKYSSNNFLVFLVTSSGISTVPIISKIGKVYGDPTSSDAIGELKASPDGSKLAAVTLRHPNIELFNFDNSTGQVSNLITLNENGAYDTIGNSSGLYGLSFSPNNTMLYTSEWYSSLGVQGKIIQYNITSNDSATINSSRVDIFTSNNKNFYSLKLAPNGKIYVGHDTKSQYLGVINFPDSSGLNCGYVDQGIFLAGKHSGWGLNNLMEYDNYCFEIPPPIDTITPPNTPIPLTDTPIISNIFTPNNDGLNDVFIIKTNDMTKLNCKIYNRWGILVNELTELMEGWDGNTSSGLQCAAGVYYWIAEYKDSTGTNNIKKGYLQLLR